MEDMNENVINITNEDGELDDVTEEQETYDSDGNGGALVAGLVGGFVAYVVIGGAKKLAAFIKTKRDAKKAAKSAEEDAVDAEFSEIEDDQEKKDSKKGSKK